MSTHAEILRLARHIGGPSYPKLSLADRDLLSEIASARLEAAEMARRHHYFVSTHEDNAVAGCWTETYKRSQADFRVALRLAYPDLDAESIYAVWVDCMEDTAYCAAWVREHPDDIPRV